ncbi:MULTISPECIES: PAS domain-containing protein [unclassified Methylobacterium]|uniref:PAS domain-containing protein n=1 Tax=unclassified Methylobacterium TaxID=2615210 RepID=UPI00226A6734|nr:MULTISPECIES: PAS domain-containing protein [unclassified Methylobacterium]
MDNGGLNFLAGGGAMGALIRGHDWASTSLGPPDTWPQSLRSAVALTIRTRQPVYMTWGPDQVSLYNDGYVPILGTKHPAGLGQPAQVLWSEIWDTMGPINAAVLAGQSQRFEDMPFALAGRDRAQSWFSFSYTPLLDDAGGIAGTFCVATETTGQKEAERELQSNEARHRRLLQQMPGFVGVLVGPEHVYEYVNDAYVEISGPREFVGRSVREVFPELVGQGFYELLDQVYATGEPFSARSMPIRLVGEGEDRHIDLLYQPVRDDGGSVTGIFVGGYDVTERVRAQRYSDVLAGFTVRIDGMTNPDAIAYDACEIIGSLLKVARVGYGTVDPIAETLHVERDWNAPGVETLAGVVPLRAYGSFVDSLKLGEFIAIDDVERDERTASAAVALRGLSVWSCVNVPVIEQGSLVALLYVNHFAVRAWTAADLAFIREVAFRARVAVERCRSERALRDLNAELSERIADALREQARTEEALRQSQKMEAVGQLTGGLAHDFNNLLAGISGSLELMQTRMSQGRFADVDRYMAAAQGASRRAAALTHRLLAFSRRQTLDPKPTNVNRLVAGMEELIQRTVGPSIHLETVGAASLWPTLVDPSQLENALLNLCINARDAMPDGGRITVETANKWLDRWSATKHDLPEGQYLSLCVTDTGTGIPPEVIARVFEPFFTTKPIGEGTGLGLSMIYGFAQQSGGQVRIYSEVGEGTTVCLYLPRHNSEGEVEEVSRKGSELPRSEQGETVLVVDDEPTVRMLVTDILEELGYTAIEAADSMAGLKVLQSDVRIDLLVTDVGLPGGMNGRQMADAGRETRPGLKVLFITGYAENSVLGNGHLKPGMAVLTKPFAVETMAARIREIIAS